MLIFKRFLPKGLLGGGGEDKKMTPWGVTMLQPLLLLSPLRMLGTHTHTCPECVSSLPLHHMLVLVPAVFKSYCQPVPALCQILLPQLQLPTAELALFASEISGQFGMKSTNGCSKRLPLTFLRAL